MGKQPDFSNARDQLFRLLYVREVNPDALTENKVRTKIASTVRLNK